MRVIAGTLRIVVVLISVLLRMEIGGTLVLCEVLGSVLQGR